MQLAGGGVTKSLSTLYHPTIDVIAGLALLYRCDIAMRARWHPYTATLVSWLFEYMILRVLASLVCYLYFTRSF